MFISTEFSLSPSPQYFLIALIVSVPVVHPCVIDGGLHPLLPPPLCTPVSQKLPSSSLTCRHQMAHHLPPTVNKSCNYASCPTKRNSTHKQMPSESARTYTHKCSRYTKKSILTMHIITCYTGFYILCKFLLRLIRLVGFVNFRNPKSFKLCTS